MIRLASIARLSSLALAAVLLFSTAANAEESRGPLPALPKAKGEQCVEDTDFMRRNHMDLLKHQRDETMHKGIRTTKHSLSECINCHVTPGPDSQPVRIDSRDHFCNSCHSYAGITIDCFQCHNSQPTGDARFHPLVSDKMRMAKEAHTAVHSAEMLNQMVKAQAGEGEAR